MKVPDNDALKKVFQWIEFADEDLRFAEHGLSIQENTPYRLIAYHAQQCAEKYLKAFLVYKNTDFPYTHNISVLLELVSDHADWAEDLRDAEELTQFAVSARYPGEDDLVDRVEAVRAIDIAGKVRSKIRSSFSSDKITIP